MRILVVGGYGFIGGAVSRFLLRSGHEVVGWGRSEAIGRHLMPGAQWISGDLRNMRSPDNWVDALSGVGAVVNASGALQDGSGGALQHIQAEAITALIDACANHGVRQFVQISAPGAEREADTAFMRTKAQADDHLRRSGLNWTILRPALVIGRNAYGGTALIRALAALPVAITVHGNSLVQCVGLDDVAKACADAVEGKNQVATDRVLAAPERYSLREVIAAHREWLGLPPARLTIDLPAVVALPLTVGADAAGWLGWRSPLRSTAVKIMRQGVVADGAVRAERLRPLQEVLAQHASGVQDRIAARLFLLLPLMVLALAGLWIGSGIIGLAEARAAAGMIGGGEAAEMMVRFCAVIDITLGLAILIRAWARRAALAMAVVSLAYMAGGSVLTPHLWLDPLAPLLKIGPALVLALVTAAQLDRR